MIFGHRVTDSRSFFRAIDKDNSYWKSIGKKLDQNIHDQGAQVNLPRVASLETRHDLWSFPDAVPIPVALKETYRDSEQVLDLVEIDLKIA